MLARTGWWARRTLVVLAGVLALVLAPSLGAGARQGAQPISVGTAVLLAGNGKADSMQPSAAGNIVVYTDCSSGHCNVIAMNLATKQASAVSPGPYDQLNPSTDGVTVVWQDARHAAGNSTSDYTNNLDLYAASLSDRKEFVVSSAPQLQGKPRVWGNAVVWADYRDASRKDDPDAGDIYMFDLAAHKERRLTDNPSSQSRPATNGKVVVWTDFRNEPDPRGFNADIYGYDIASGQEFPVAVAPDLQTDPAIYGNRVIWQDYRNATDVNDYNADIYGYDLQTKKEFVVTTSPGRQADPAIAGDLVAWTDWRNEPDEETGTNSDIYAFDLATGREFPVSMSGGAQRAPSIGGTTVVFETRADLGGKAVGGIWGVSATAVSGVKGGVSVPLPPPVAVPGGATRQFPETGESASGLFLDYWEKNGGLPQQGFPISGVIGEISDLDGKPYSVQYFERAVFEYHPENRAPYDVLLSQLGTFQYKAKYPNGAPNQKQNQTGGQFFRETGHWVGGKFLDYWRAHGALAQQGYPISDEFVEVSDLNGKPYTVQYFERAVFELHPENQPPNDVLLSQLGTFQYRAKYGGR